MNMDLTGVMDEAKESINKGNAYGDRPMTDAIPDGKYPVEVVNVELGKSFKGYNTLYVSFKVIAGGCEGLVTESQFTVDPSHPSQKHVQINAKQICQLMINGGHKNPGQLRDAKELLGLRLEVVVANDSYVDGSGTERESCKPKFYNRLRDLGVYGSVVPVKVDSGPIEGTPAANPWSVEF